MMTPISDYQIETVNKLHANGITRDEIMKEAGISSATYYRIINGSIRKSGEPDPMPILDKMPGEFTPRPTAKKRRLVRRVTVSGTVMTAVSDGDTISLSVCDQNGIKLSYLNFKTMCEDAALMLESMLEREQRGIYSLE